MNPYLEDPSLWREVHQRFIVCLANELNQNLPEPYSAFIEDRVYMESVDVERQIQPDVLVSKPAGVLSSVPAAGTALADTPTHIELRVLDPIREPYIQIFAGRGRNRVLVAVIELLSPTNKTPNAVGRAQYLEKQQQLLQSTAHLMEIDLLHYGEHTVFLPRGAILADGDWDYLVVLHKAGWGGARGDVWRVCLEQRLPRVAVPLLPGDGAVVLDLQEALERVYAEGRFDRKVDYTQPPPVPLSEEKLAWVQQIVQAANR
jgi:hypothetical protein